MNIAAADFGGVRGAAAAANVDPYDVVVDVPEDCLITADTALQSDIVRRDSAVHWLAHMEVEAETLQMD